MTAVTPSMLNRIRAGLAANHSLNDIARTAGLPSTSRLIEVCKARGIEIGSRAWAMTTPSVLPPAAPTKQPDKPEKKTGVRGRPRSAIRISILPKALEQLEEEGVRLGINAETVARRLIETIAKDNLFNAVLDE